MNLTLIVDNLASDGLRKEHGLGFLIETDSGDVLFDTGQSDAWLENLYTLGKDPNRVIAVALSHGHYDHTGGLSALPQANAVPCHIHPLGVWPRYAIDAQSTREIGVPRDVFMADPRFVYNRTAAEIVPGITLSGEIPLTTPGHDPSQGRFYCSFERRNPDTFIDEQCLILREDDSVAVLVGCSHRGVESNVRAAMELAGTDHLSLLAGGMHLGNADDDRLQSVTAFLAAMDIDRIVCCHCTGNRAFRYLEERLGDRVVQGQAGMRWTVGKGVA